MPTARFLALSAIAALAAPVPAAHAQVPQVHHVRQGSLDVSPPRVEAEAAIDGILD